MLDEYEDRELARFKLPYCGAPKIGNLYAYHFQNHICYGKLFFQTDTGYVDRNGVVFTEAEDGYLMEATI